MSFTVRGEAAVNTILGNLSFAFKRGILDGGFVAVGLIVRRAQVGMINGPHSGRKYPRLPNQSSAPGEYAATQSGTLLGSITGTNTLFQMRISATAPHAGYIEYGTSKMAARPPVANAIRDTEPQVLSVIDKAIWRRIA